MTKPTTLTNGRDSGRLEPLSNHEQREVIRRWSHQTDGTAGERGTLPETPDDPVAFKLLDAANLAMEQGALTQAVEILRLVVREFRQSQEAACARRVIDRLAIRPAGRGDNPHR